MKAAGVFAALLLLAEQSPLYEEDPLATMQIRVDNWKQLQAYAAALPAVKAKPAPAGPESALGALLRARTGYPPPRLFGKVKERLEKTGEDTVAAYYRCRIRVSEEMEAYGLYIVPKNRRGRAPLVISQHGGGGFPEMATYQGGGNYHDMVRGAVAEGYVVYAPLLVMYPYKDRNHGTPIPENVRADLDAALRAKGTSLAAVEIAKIAKALDALAKRPEVDPRRIGMAGLSYGGYYTLFTTALEPRIRAAVASCSFRDQPAETANPAGRLVDLSSEEVTALIAPRPLQVQAGINDKLFPIENVRSAIAKAGKRYAGHDANFAYEEFDGGHEFRGALAWAYFKKHLRGEK